MTRASYIQLIKKSEGLVQFVLFALLNNSKKVELHTDCIFYV